MTQRIHVYSIEGGNLSSGKDINLFFASPRIVPNKPYIVNVALSGATIYNYQEERIVSNIISFPSSGSKIFFPQQATYGILLWPAWDQRYCISLFNIEDFLRAHDFHPILQFSVFSTVVPLLTDQFIACQTFDTIYIYDHASNIVQVLPFENPLTQFSLSPDYKTMVLISNNYFHIYPSPLTWKEQVYRLLSYARLSPASPFYKYHFPLDLLKFIVSMIVPSDPAKL